MEEWKRVLLIVPAYNEAENIERVVENLIRNFPQHDYVVINDGSTDGTGKLCMEKEYQVLNLPINLGIGGAVQTGDAVNSSWYLAGVLLAAAVLAATIVIRRRKRS